jgi:hypothetical protein
VLEKFFTRSPAVIKTFDRSGNQAGLMADINSHGLSDINKPLWRENQTTDGQDNP